MSTLPSRNDRPDPPRRPNYRYWGSVGMAVAFAGLIALIALLWVENVKGYDAPPPLWVSIIVILGLGHTVFIYCYSRLHGLSYAIARLRAILWTVAYGVPVLALLLMK